MMGQTLSKLLGRKAVAWVGAGLLSVAAIPAIGATKSHLAHKARTGVTHRTVHATKPHHRSTGKLAVTTKKAPLHAAHAKVATLNVKHRGGTPLAAVSSMHSGHRSTVGKLTTTRHHPAAVRTLSTSRKHHAAAIGLASAHRSSSRLGALEFPTDLRASRRVAAH